MKRMWQSFRGRERLLVVFWVYCIGGGLLAVALPSVVAEPLYDLGFPVWFFILLALVQGLYLLWAHVSVWTCAFNSSRRLWGYAARGYVCAVVATLTAYMFLPSSQPELEVLKLSAAQQAHARDVRNARA